MGGYAAAFNGGGVVWAEYGAINIGGGATDFRLKSGAWNNAQSLNSRILIAGGSGSQSNSGYGGGAIGGAANGGYGGTQITGGEQIGSACWDAGHKGRNGSFGAGGGGGWAGGNMGGGGGGGYYGGGGGSDCTCYLSGGGGSSFISGFSDCTAIDPTDVSGNPRQQDNYSSNIHALNYKTSIFGASPTWKEEDEIVFANPVMIDGEGYSWSTGREGSPSYQMPKPAGGMYDSSEKGHAGHGYARITRLEY